MPTEKRTRKRAAREAKMAVLERQRRRRARTRRVITLFVVGAVVVGIYFALKGGKTTPAKASAQDRADTAAVAGGCASAPTTPLHKPSWSKAPAMTIDATKTYQATVKTDAGSFTVTLDAKHAPVTVNNFVFLADQNFYNCVTFHRVVPGFMDQTGDPTGTGSGSAGYKFVDELPAKATPQYPVGSVAMANSGPNTNGSQFFVVTGSQGATLAPNYTLFGQVTSGTAVPEKINADGNANPSSNGVPPKVIHRILSVKISSS